MKKITLKFYTQREEAVQDYYTLSGGAEIAFLLSYMIFAISTLWFAKGITMSVVVGATFLFISGVFAIFAENKYDLAKKLSRQRK